MHYDLLLPRRVVFGWGRRGEIGKWASTLGRRAFVIVGSRTLERDGTLDELLRTLAAHDVSVQRLPVISREPRVADVDFAAAEVRRRNPGAGDLVIGIGGGAALDLAKAVAALATNRTGASVHDYLEGVGSGLTLTETPLPMLAVPTTAGTGSEATKNAVISSHEPRFKKSLRSESMLPQIVLIDPQLTVSAPPHVTAHSGLDALTQLIESFISKRATPVTRALCCEGLRRGWAALPIAFQDGRSRPAREAMSHAAFLSGAALANSGLGIAHGVAAALGVHCDTPHGLACAVMLPVALRLNRDVALADLAELSRHVGASRATHDDEAADQFIVAVTELVKSLGVPSRLSDLGVQPAHIADLVNGSRGNSRDGNPRPISDDELAAALMPL